jgi:hypothetical protein
MTSAFLYSHAVRAAVLWVLVRSALVPFLIAGARLPFLPPDPQASVIHIPGRTAFAVSILVTVFVLLDVRAMRERVFLANLGIGLQAVAVTAFLTVALIELIVYTAFALT